MFDWPEMVPIPPPPPPPPGMAMAPWPWAVALLRCRPASLLRCLRGDAAEFRGASAGHDGRDASQLCGASPLPMEEMVPQPVAPNASLAVARAVVTTEGAGSVTATKLALGAADTKASAISY